MSHRPTPHRSDHEIDRLLASATGPAIVVAPRASRLEAANASGRAWIGAQRQSVLADPEVAPRSDATPLDPAMPAVKRLKELAANLGAGSRCSVTLTFWTSEGVRTALCDVAFIRAGEDALALIELRDDRTLAAAENTNETSDDGPAPQPAQSTPGPTRDDAAILKEIARRIREGQSMRAPVPADPQDPTQAVIDDAPGSPQPSSATPAGGPGHPVAGNLAGEAAEVQSIRIARLAHELKTPLSAIVAAAEIMRDERFGPIENARYRSYASDIFDSARHALMVIGNMLGDAAAGIDFDQASGLPAMVFTEVDLNAVADSCVSSMRPLADAAGLGLSASLADGLPHIIADATAVRQIALNLLTNAVKFSSTGGEIRLVTRYDCDGRVELVVRDTGRGMTAEEIAKAEAPHEGSALARREGGGLGIGLPLVGALARANGAGIAIASELSRGTTVTLSFARDRVVPV